MTLWPPPAKRSVMSAPRSIAIPFAVACLGIALFSGMDAVMKHLVLQLGTYNAMLWRMGLVALVGGLAFLATRQAWPERAVVRVHIVRGLVMAVMGLLFFWGLGRVPLAQAIALAFISPLIALYLAAILLKERIERRAILASVLGVVGVVVIVVGQAEAALGREALLGSLAILASACLYAYNIILMRQQALVAGPLEVAFFMSLIISIVFLTVAPWFAVPPPAAAWPAVVGAALLSFGSLMLLAWAYRRAEAQHLAPVEYTAFVWAALLGWVYFDEAVGAFTLAGAVLIVAACLLAASRRRPDPAAKVEAFLPGGA